MPIGAIPYVLAGLIWAISVAAGGWKGYEWGRASAERQIAVEAAKAARLRADLAYLHAEAEETQERIRTAGEKVRVEYRTRVRTIREKAPPEVIERIRVETLACPVNSNLVGLWNAPVENEADRAAAGVVDTGIELAPSVSQAELAEAVAEAKRRFAFNTIKLEALQEWAKSVQRETGR